MECVIEYESYIFVIFKQTLPNFYWTDLKKNTLIEVNHNSPICMPKTTKRVVSSCIVMWNLKRSTFVKLFQSNLLQYISFHLKDKNDQIKLKFRGSIQVLPNSAGDIQIWPNV